MSARGRRWLVVLLALAGAAGVAAWSATSSSPRVVARYAATSPAPQAVGRPEGTRRGDRAVLLGPPTRWELELYADGSFRFRTSDVRIIEERRGRWRIDGSFYVLHELERSGEGPFVPSLAEWRKIHRESGCWEERWHRLGGQITHAGVAGWWSDRAAAFRMSRED